MESKKMPISRSVDYSVYRPDRLRLDLRNFNITTALATLRDLLDPAIYLYHSQVVAELVLPITDH